MFKLLRLFLLSSLSLSSVQLAQARTFEAEGSDLLLGVGAKQVAMGGAAAASTDDIYAIYWNPAGLTEMEETQFTVSRQLNATLSPLNFIGIGVVSDKLNFAGLKSTLSLALIPRLHTASTGVFREDELQSMFLRYTLPHLPADFDGKLESKTRDYRLSWALTPQDSPKWSAAFTLSRIECTSKFCGVTAEDPGNYIISSTTATAYGFHLGGKYYYSDALTFGLNIEDVMTELDVHIVQTDSSGTSRKKLAVPLPRDIALGVHWKESPSLDLTMDYQYVSGSYGVYSLDLQILRGGINYRKKDWQYRAGLLVPISIETDNTGDLKKKLPFPVLPTTGIGWRYDKVNMDFALYPHALMSYHHNNIYLAADLSISYKF